MDSNDWSGVLDFLTAFASNDRQMTEHRFRFTSAVTSDVCTAVLADNVDEPIVIKRGPLHIVEDEARLLKKLHSPRTVKYLDHGSIHLSCTWVLLLELHTPFLEYFLDRDDVIHFPTKWALDMMEALHHCHYNFVCHMDVKPDNFLVNDVARLILADFGISRQMRSNQDTFIFDGACTPAYAPPFRRRQKVDCARPASASFHARRPRPAS